MCAALAALPLVGKENKRIEASRYRRIDGLLKSVYFPSLEFMPGYQTQTSCLTSRTTVVCSVAVLHHSKNIAQHDSYLPSA